MSVIVAAHIGDIHFGAFDTDILLRELKHKFIKPMKKMPKLDVIFIEGDLYNHELSLNSKGAYNSFKFKEMLEEVAYKQSAKIRAIKGTKSHDFNQLKNLKFGNKVDFQVINKVCKEKLFDDYKVLYLPEEYMKDPEEYYKDYLDVKDDYYDVIIGHGSFEETSFNNFNSESQISTAPIFNSKKICKICRGLISFGHIHDAVILRNQIYYTGSFSRWCYGEENPKGFYFSLYNTETGHYKIVPVINTMARTFITKNMTKYILNNPIEKIIRKIEKLLYVDYVDNLRIKIKEINDKEFLTKLDILKNYFSSNNHIVIDIKKLNNISDDIEEEKELINKYSYLFEDLSVEEQSTRFINEEYGYEITKEKVEDILNKDIIKLINDEIYDGGENL